MSASLEKKLKRYRTFLQALGVANLAVKAQITTARTRLRG
jgi:hypothetical protein